MISWNQIKGKISPVIEVLWFVTWANNAVKFSSIQALHKLCSLAIYLVHAQRKNQRFANIWAIVKLQFTNVSAGLNNWSIFSKLLKALFILIGRHFVTNSHLFIPATLSNPRIPLSESYSSVTLKVHPLKKLVAQGMMKLSIEMVYLLHKGFERQKVNKKA